MSKKLNRFSSRFGTYAEWRRGRTVNAYAKRIILLHRLNPRLSLKRLQSTSKQTQADLSRKQWRKLTVKQAVDRRYSLKVLSEMRNGKSIEEASKTYNLDVELVKRHLKRALKKQGKEFVAKPTDKIEREVFINENGETKAIVVSNFETASTIGSYHVAVKKFLDTGDTALLKPFDGLVVKDSKGKKHLLETRPEKLYEIEDAREDSELYDIYNSD